MQGHHGVAARLQTQFTACIGRLDRLAQHLEGVDHDIADAIDLRGRYAFGYQILIAVLGWRPQDIRDGIGDKAIDFFGHAAVATAEASLEMHDRDPEFRPDHCAGGR